MDNPTPTDGSARNDSQRRPGEYVVIARRYRPQSFNELIGQEHVAKGLVAAMGLFVVAFLVAILIISTYVYRQCRLVVSDKSVIQVMQKALFNRKISRLSMSNVEDVNVIQQGVLASMFNFGTLTIQTAGEVDNFVFTLCPSPDIYANRILEARQAYARSFSDEHEN